MRRSALIIAATVVLTATVVLAAFAAPDRTVTVDGATPVATWKGAAALGLNFTFFGEPEVAIGQCGKQAPNYCEDNVVNVNVPAGSGAKMKVTITPEAADPTETIDDFDLMVYASDAAGVPGKLVDTSGSGIPEVVDVSNASGFYLVRVVYFATVQGGYDAKIELTGAPAPGAPGGGGTATPTPGPGGPTATPTPTATATPPRTQPGGTLPASGTLSADFAVDRTKRKTAASRGLRVRVRCSVQCKATAVAAVDRKSARALKLGKRPVKIGQGSATITKAGRIPFTIKLTKKAKKALRRKKVKKFTITVNVKITDRNGGQIKTGNKRLTVKR